MQAKGTTLRVLTMETPCGVREIQTQQLLIVFMVPLAQEIQAL